MTVTDDLRGDRPRAVIADEVLRTPADVLRALTECAHRGEPFEARGFTADGFVPTDLLRDVLAGRMTL